MEKLVLENNYKIVVLLFGAAYDAPNKGITRAEVDGTPSQIPTF